MKYRTMILMDLALSKGNRCIAIVTVHGLTSKIGSARRGVSLKYSCLRKAFNSLLAIAC